MSTNGPALAVILDELFGEETKRAYKRQAEHLSQARADGTLRSQLNTGFLTTAASRSIPIKANTFYGNTQVAR